MKQTRERLLSPYVHITESDPITATAVAPSGESGKEVEKDGEYWRGVMQATRHELQGLADTWSAVLAEKKDEVPEDGMALLAAHSTRQRVGFNTLNSVVCRRMPTIV